MRAWGTHKLPVDSRDARSTPAMSRSPSGPARWRQHSSCASTLSATLRIRCPNEPSPRGTEKTEAKLVEVMPGRGLQPASGSGLPLAPGPVSHWLVRILRHKLRLYEREDMPFGRLVGAYPAGRSSARRT